MALLAELVKSRNTKHSRSFFLRKIEAIRNSRASLVSLYIILRFLGNRDSSKVEIIFGLKILTFCEPQVMEQLLNVMIEEENYLSLINAKSLKMMLLQLSCSKFKFNHDFYAENNLIYLSVFS